MEKIICLIKEPSKPIKWARICNDLHTLQRIAANGGFIEKVTFDNKVVVICDEEGRLKRLPYCCTVCGTHFFGTVIFAGVKDEDFADLDLKVTEFAKYVPASDKRKEDTWED